MPCKKKLNFRNAFSQAKEYFQLLTPYWGSRKSLFSWIILGGALILCTLSVYILIVMNRLTGDFFQFIESKDKNGVITNFAWFSFVIAIYMVAHAFRSLLISLVGFRWREFMTNAFIGKWLKSKAYYDQKEIIDNPDQRISSDINLFNETFLTFFLYVYTEFFSLLAFVGVLWNFSAPLKFSIGPLFISIPHYLALICLLYAIGINLFMFWVGHPLISLDYQQEKREADFRYSLMRLKTYGEEVAFHRGETFEKKVFEEKFNYVKTNFLQLIRRRFIIDLTNYGYFTSLSILPTLAAFPLYFSDEITFGSLMQVNNAFATVLGALSILVTSFQSFASLHAAKNRLYQFQLSIKESETSESLNYEKSETNGIVFSNISIQTPAKTPIISDFYLRIREGEKVLMMGRSGMGKTSLIRILSQIWKHQKGRIILPSEEIFFTPQKPYFPLGSLRDCLAYPKPELLYESDQSMKEILEKVSLAHLVPLLDQELDWMRSLSIGEQQRVNFARILLHHPKVLVMDEPTSSLDAVNEGKMLQLLYTSLPKITLLTISHSERLKPFHDRCVDLYELDLVLPQKNGI